MKKSNIYSFQNIDEIRAEARSWVLAFDKDEEPSEEDIKTFRDWVNRSPSHRSELEKAQTFWEQSDRLSVLAVPMSKTEKKLQKKNGKYPLALAFLTNARFASIAVFALTLSILFSGLVSFDNTSGNGTYATTVGEQAVLHLKDQSTLHLDTNSQVKVTFDKHKRRILLIQGKAHFNVTHDPSRPFEVLTDKGVIRAIGTAFSVAVGFSKIKVSVNEGQVAVVRTPSGDNNASTSEQKSDLDAQTNETVFASISAGQSLIFDQDNKTLSQLNSAALLKEFSWKNGILIFTGEPLSDVIYEISRYTDMNISVSDPAINQLPIGGRFRVGELDALFHTLEKGFGIRAIHQDKNHIALSFLSNTVTPPDRQ